MTTEMMCAGCGNRRLCVYADDRYLCADCLFAQVDAENLVFESWNECESCGSRASYCEDHAGSSCESCGDYGSYMYCEDCRGGYCDNCGEPGDYCYYCKSQCDNCGNEGAENVCKDCAPEYFEFTSTTSANSDTLSIEPKQLALGEPIVSDDGATITVDGVDINWG